MDQADWLQCAAWMALKWPNQPLDSETVKAWYTTMHRFEVAAVGAAIDILAERMPMRPALSDLIAETKNYIAGHEIKALPEPRENTDYGAAYRALISAAMEERKAKEKPVTKAMMAVAKEHERWFLEHPGQPATPLMTRQAWAATKRPAEAINPAPPMDELEPAEAGLA